MRLKRAGRSRSMPRPCGPPMRLGKRGSFVGLAAAALSLSGCKLGVLAPIGPVGDADKAILIDSVVIMLAIVVPTAVATLLFAWWFRASNAKARHLPNWKYSGQIELVVWGIPALVVLLLGGVAWIGAHDLDPAVPLPSPQPPLQVEVVSLDWKWLFVYPKQGIASLNRLVLPVGVPIHFSLTSATVMSAFFVPQLGSMIYTMNGMATQLYLQANEQGVFNGLSSHFNGDGFSGMHFDVDVTDQTAFEQWAKAAGTTGAALNADSYRALLQQSAQVKPTTFKLEDPSLYEAIVMQKLPPGSGPQTGRPDASVSPRSGAHHVR